MRSNFQLLLLTCSIAIATNAQDVQPPSLNLGDPAPPLLIREWVKDTPVQKFEKGHVYVLEFWATWCKPCIAAMPHLSTLSQKYKDKVTILGIDVMEKKTTPIKKVKAFVDSMGERMNYHVAIEDSNFMVSDWFNASGERGIPNSFVVNEEGRLAWIGHPKDLDEVLYKIVNKTWNVQEELTRRNESRRLAILDDSLRWDLFIYAGDYYKHDYIGKPDSALLAINEIISKKPKLKYAPFIASYTFSSLLKTNPHKAYEYGKAVIVTPTYDDPAYGIIIEQIQWYSDKLKIPAEIYELGAEAYQLEIDHITYPELVHLSRLYYKMAEWYWRAKNKSKAINAQQKAIKELKKEKGFSETDMNEFELRLEQYKKIKNI